jgi:hypothetical protein
MEHLKSEKGFLISCDRICYKNEPNKCEEHCENYYIWQFIKIKIKIKTVDVLQ